MVKWKELCVDMERFDEEFLGKFSCTTEALTAEKIKASRSREAILSDWVLKFAEMYHNITTLLTLLAGTRMEELNSAVVKGQEKVIAPLQEEQRRTISCS